MDVLENIDDQLMTNGSELVNKCVPVGNTMLNSKVRNLSSEKGSEDVHHLPRWSKSSYLLDSGIHSALGTQTPSGKTFADELDADDHLMNDKPCSVGQWSSGFPMSVHPNDCCMLSPGTPSASSTVGFDTPCASQSACHLDSQGNKLPDIDTDEAAGAIPDLVRLIKDEDDQVIIYQSAMMVFQLSKSEAIDALIKSEDMIECIISALDRAEDPETVRFLSGTLYNMSQTQTGLKAIFAADCIRCLAKLLNSSVESVLFYSITTLHNLLLHQEGAKKVVRESGCLQKMSFLLHKDNIKFLTICTDCLQILAYGHQESKLQILSAGGPAELVRILRTYQYEKLLWTTARVLKVLTVCTSNKPAIIAAGGMDALSKHLSSSSGRLVLNCLCALRNLSDAATKLGDLEPLLHSLVHLLDCGDGSMITCAAGILSNLTCNNRSNKYIVYKFGGIEGILRAIGQVGIKEDILEPCMCALRHLTSRHDEEENARRMIVQDLIGLPNIARILHAVTCGICPELGFVCHPPQCPLSSWTLIKAMVGLLRNLSVNIDSNNEMRENGLVEGLFILLCAALSEIKKHTTDVAANSHLALATVVQSVRLEEIVEGICGALHMLVKDHTTRSHLAVFTVPNLVVSPNIHSGSSGLEVFVHLLYSTHESIQRAAAGLLSEVSQDCNGLDALANIPDITCRFNELANSRCEALSTYASAVLIRLNDRLLASPEDGSCIFAVHVDSLNTPPVPMDTVGLYSDVANSSSSPSALVRQFHHMGASLRPTTVVSSRHHSYGQRPLSPALPQPHGSSHQNTLMAMLGPPPSSTYKLNPQNCSLACCRPWADDCCADGHCQYGVAGGSPCSQNYCNAMAPALPAYPSYGSGHCAGVANPCSAYLHYASEYASPPPPATTAPSLAAARRPTAMMMMDIAGGDYIDFGSGDLVLHPSGPGHGQLANTAGTAQAPLAFCASGRQTRPQRGVAVAAPPAYYSHQPHYLGSDLNSTLSPPGSHFYNSRGSNSTGFHSPLEAVSSGASDVTASKWLANSHHDDVM